IQTSYVIEQEGVKAPEMGEFDPIIRKTEAYFSEKLTAHGDTARGVDWRDEKAQEQRFQILSRLFRTRGDFSILDVGCGTGAFYNYLACNGFRNIHYTGLDLLEKMVACGRSKFAGDSNAYFENGTIEQLNDSFDYTIASGIYNA